MRRALPQTMSATVKKLNAGTLASLSYADTQVCNHAETGNKSFSAKDKRAEKELHKQCEDWLHHHGYSKRVPDNMASPGGYPLPSRGWQIHLHKPKGNPKLLDILLLGHDGRYIEIELKVQGGSLDDEQAYLVKQGGHLAYSFDEFVRIVIAWENPEDHEQM